jgi:hypothetical protein
VSVERVAASVRTPMLQEPVHVDVGQQWTYDAALRRAARVSLAAPGFVRLYWFELAGKVYLA